MCFLYIYISKCVCVYIYNMYVCTCINIYTSTYIHVYIHIWAFLVAQFVKNLPAMWETWVQSLGFENPMEKGKATHFSILAWRIPWTV